VVEGSYDVIRPGLPTLIFGFGYGVDATSCCNRSADSQVWNMFSLVETVLRHDLSPELPS
jgi:hypothetical protein